MNYRINEHGYLEKKMPTRSKGIKHSVWRNWFLARYQMTLHITKLYIPARYAGKRFRIRIEVMKDEEKAGRNV